MVRVNKRLGYQVLWATATRTPSGEGRRSRVSDSYFSGGIFGFGGSSGGGDESHGDGGHNNNGGGGDGNNVDSNGNQTLSDTKGITGATNSTSTNVTTSESNSHGFKSNTGAIAGIASGTVVVVGVLLVVVLYLCFRKLRGQQKDQLSSGKQLLDEQQEQQRQHQLSPTSPPSSPLLRPQDNAEADMRNESSALSSGTIESAVTLKMAASHGMDLHTDSPPSYADIEMGYLNLRSVDLDGTVCNGFHRYRSDML